MERSFDVVVLGAGPAGETAAGRLGEAGLEVAVVEAHLVGGECSYYACMPSKALLRPGQVAAEAERTPGVGGGPLDVPAVLRRRDEVVYGLDDAAQLPWLEQRGVSLVRGPGRLDGERRVAVGGDVLVARQAVVLATGTGPLLPPLPGLAEAAVWTNREGTNASTVPRRLLVLGGGVAGVELAQAWASLAAQVTVLEGAERLLVREEPFAGEQVAEGLRALGATVRTGVRAVAVRREGDVTVELDDGSRATGDELLVAVGRRPATSEIGLESVGLEPGEAVEVGDDLRSVRHDWLWAVGDVNGRAPLTHMGKYHGALSPRVIFTEPQVAAVGHTLVSAREAGLTVRAVDVDTAGSAGGVFTGVGAPGTSRFVVDEDRRILLGATFTGPEVAEWLHAATIAVVGEVPLDTLWHAVPPFPTRSEVWLKLLEAYGL